MFPCQLTISGKWLDHNANLSDRRDPPGMVYSEFNVTVFSVTAVLENVTSLPLLPLCKVVKRSEAGGNTSSLSEGSDLQAVCAAGAVSQPGMAVVFSLSPSSSGINCTG